MDFNLFWYDGTVFLGTKMHVLNDVEYGRMLTPPTISMTLSDDEKAFIDAKIDWIGKLFIHSLIHFLLPILFHSLFFTQNWKRLLWYDFAHGRKTSCPRALTDQCNTAMLIVLLLVLALTENVSFNVSLLPWNFKYCLLLIFLLRSLQRSLLTLLVAYLDQSHIFIAYHKPLVSTNFIYNRPPPVDNLGFDEVCTPLFFQISLCHSLIHY